MGVSRQAHRDSIECALKYVAGEYKKGGYFAVVRPMICSNPYDRLQLTLSQNIMICVDVSASSGNYHYKWKALGRKPGVRKPTPINGMQMEKCIPHSTGDGVAYKDYDVQCIVKEVVAGINNLIDAINKSGMPLHA